MLTKIEKRKDLDVLKSNETYLLGILATDIQEYPNLGETREAVTKMKNKKYTEKSNMIFYLESVSEEPEYITKVVNSNCNSGKLYVGIDNHHRNVDIYPFGYKDQNTYNLLSYEEKKEDIYNEFEGKLILFKPIISYDQSTGMVYKNVKIQSIIGDYNKNTKYTYIPVVKMNHESFENKLRTGEYIYLQNYNNNMILPEFVICGEYIYSNFQSWKKHDENYKLWCCDRGYEEIRRNKIEFTDDDYKDDILDILDDLLFVSQDFLYNRLYEISDKGESIFKEKYIERYDDNSNNIEDIEEYDKNNYNDLTNVSNLSHSNLKNTENLEIEEELNYEENIKNIFKSASMESEFLMKFKSYTVKNNLCYDIKDIVNFHISVKTNPLTILAGMSGTGKLK
ncbi:hypothetical protein [Faecalimicrobium dakarense]|uniref:hypothetical protein n=1 Tax=Faecalimicrobium dakarense TaxID=1301100 RepID=UPI0004AE565B|nr:hypothetical protein [[Clostridium] dakarense]